MGRRRKVRPVQRAKNNSSNKKIEASSNAATTSQKPSNEVVDSIPTHADCDVTEKMIDSKNSDVSEAAVACVDDGAVENDVDNVCLISAADVTTSLAPDMSILSNILEVLERIDGRLEKMSAMQGNTHLILSTILVCMLVFDVFSLLFFCLSLCPLKKALNKQRGDLFL